MAGQVGVCGGDPLCPCRDTWPCVFGSDEPGAWLWTMLVVLLVLLEL